MSAQSDLISDEMSLKIIDVAEKYAMASGAENITVRVILKELGITNRVFYNRFHNIDEVLNIVYEKTILKLRENILSSFDPEGDFFAQVIDIMTNTLIMSYKKKMQFNLYVFESDSRNDRNYEWWKGEIINLLEFGRMRGYIKDVDSDAFSYSVWCFIRGFNADALMREIPIDEAVRIFRYSFGILIDGLRK